MSAQPEERRDYFRQYRAEHPHRWRPFTPDPVDEARHRESVRRWAAAAGYDLDGWLPWDVRELKRSAGL